MRRLQRKCAGSPLGREGPGATGSKQQNLGALTRANHRPDTRPARVETSCLPSHHNNNGGAPRRGDAPKHPRGRSHGVRQGRVSRKAKAGPLRPVCACTRTARAQARGEDPAAEGHPDTAVISPPRDLDSSGSLGKAACPWDSSRCLGKVACPEDSSGSLGKTACPRDSSRRLGGWAPAASATVAPKALYTAP